MILLEFIAPVLLASVLISSAASLSFSASGIGTALTGAFVYQLVVWGIYIAVISVSGYMLYKAITAHERAGSVPIVLASVALGCSVFSIFLLGGILHIVSLILLMIACGKLFPKRVPKKAVSCDAVGVEPRQVVSSTSDIPLVERTEVAVNRWIEVAGSIVGFIGCMVIVCVLGWNFLKPYIPVLKATDTPVQTESPVLYSAEDWFDMCQNCSDIPGLYESAYDGHEIYIRGVVTDLTEDSFRMLLIGDSQRGAMTVSMADGDSTQVFDGADVLVRGFITGTGLRDATFIKVYGTYDYSAVLGLPTVG